MTTHHAEIRIDAPIDRVWDSLADFAGVWQYNPSVKTSYSLNGSDTGLGAERRCELTLAGAVVDERIVEWDEGEGYTVEILGGKKLPPIRNVRARLDVRSEGDVSIASGTMSYDPRFGPFGRAMDRFMIRKQFGKAWTGIFAGLKYHAETGEVVAKGVKLDLSPVDYAVA